MLYTTKKNLFKDVEAISIHSHYVGWFFPGANLVQIDNTDLTIDAVSEVPS